MNEHSCIRFHFADGDEVNDSPMEQVRLTVPITDDPTLPCLTFRTWFLGILSCAILAFVNQFFYYRQNALTITSVSAQILVLPAEKFMAYLTSQSSLYSCYKVVFLFESRSFQHKRACTHHNICEFWIILGLCYWYCDHSPGLL